MESHVKNVRFAFDNNISRRCKSCSPSIARSREVNNITDTACLKILSIFGHKILDEQLMQHNIKRHRSKSARFVRNLMSNRLCTVETPGFRGEDLEKLSLLQLRELKESFAKKVKEKAKEWEEDEGMKQIEADRKLQFLEDIRNIELATRNVLKPCVNVLPDSDDMARVLLLN